MEKEELHELIQYEVFGGKRRSVLKRWYLRSFIFGKNINYLIRKCQYWADKIDRSFVFYTIWRFYKGKLKRLYGVFLGKNVRIGKGLIMPHPNGVIIGKGVSIGEHCSIYQQVTIGGKYETDSMNGNMPIIGDNCLLYAGCKVLGNIKVANGTIVGANSVLLTDTVENGVYVGSPAVLKGKRS